MDWGTVDTAAIVALGAAWTAWLKYRLDSQDRNQKVLQDKQEVLQNKQDSNHVDARDAVERVQEKVEKISRDVDGLSSKREKELTDVKVDLGTALGTAQGRADQKAEAKADAKEALPAQIERQEKP
jgi:hypothetical protein